jgi:hypothetical protein
MWRLVIGVPIVVVIVLIAFVITPVLASCGSADELVEDAVERCPRAKELLGDDAHPARLGCACGTTELEGNYGRSSWSVPYTGSRGRGTVQYDASQHAGTWTLDRANLEVDGENIDLVACSGTAAAKPSATMTLAQTNADAATATFDGKVIRSTHPTVKVGATCRGELARERGSPTARVNVSCEGADALYAGTGSFSMDVGDATRRDDDRSEYDDSKTSDGDGTAGCRLSGSGAKGTLTIWDMSPAYEVVVEL